MDIFEFRNAIIDDYSQYISSFITIRDERIRSKVEQSFREGVLWPDPLIQLNPTFQRGELIDGLVGQQILHDECKRIFQVGKAGGSAGRPLQLHWHQEQAIRTALGGHNYVLTTGTGSGKSLSYIVPIVDQVLREGSGKGIRAIVVYPMNALANSQLGELRKFLKEGYDEGKEPVTFARYTGQESAEERDEIIKNPPDILLTNYVMLEYILTRPYERPLVRAAQDLRFLVLDELHTYRGRQGSDVALLVRRVREALHAERLQCVGTSATMATGGTLVQQQEEISTVASLLFGDTVHPEHVVGERLDRATVACDLDDAEFVRKLTERVTSGASSEEIPFSLFREDPLSVWIESIFGVEEEAETGRLKRRVPRGILGDAGAAIQLAASTGLDVGVCATAIMDALLCGYKCRRPDNDFPAFAFRLHQFISRGDAAYASLEDESVRYITLNGQRFVPNTNQSHILVPMVFCRECGQEYYTVRAKWSGDKGQKDGSLISISARPVEERQDDREDGQSGYLYISAVNPWPDDVDEFVDLVPDDWCEEFGGGSRIRKDRIEHLPIPIRVAQSGEVLSDGVCAQFISGAFRFCLRCGVDYGVQRGTDFAKLSSLSSEGRSTATTLLSLSAIRKLRSSDLGDEAKKLLSFTDNRQDAALQAGHFNDFVEVGLIRSALYKAALASGPDGIDYDRLTQSVFTALNLDLKYFASNPMARFGALRDTQRALQVVLGYRLYRDLRRGWRVTSPNLEQCGLLEITYDSLEELCEDDSLWGDAHAALVACAPSVRKTVAKTLLDYMRRELAIKVEFLEADTQTRIKSQSNQSLIAPWAIDENENMEIASVVYAGSRPNTKAPYRKGQQTTYDPTGVYISARGGFGRYLKRRTTFPDYSVSFKTEDIGVIISQLLHILSQNGLIEQVVVTDSKHPLNGYQLLARTMRWMASDGATAFHDPIRVPRPPADGARTNTFFVNFYKSAVEELPGLEAREHTAQVPYDEREKREERFRTADLPVLYCSPTMELGVDIASLNVVNLRNIPPTPANYAQRSGRAGRSGQPALVFSYCSTGNSHDQYFFRSPTRMVAGEVTSPRLDLTNEDLIRAHIHAIWLAETRADLSKSLKDILDLNGEEPTLELLESVRDSIENAAARVRARAGAEHVLATLGPQLRSSDWYSNDWLDDVFVRVTERFDASCERWRELYRAARDQAKAQARIILDASRPFKDQEQAKRLRKEAEEQMRLLTQVDSVAQSDFYSYRYFASEGFLPGYNFPRLPLSAFIPARKASQSDSFVSRPRFLAISEFGPRSVIYHEGSRYIINKVIMPVSGDDQQREIPVQSAKLCPSCGYLHPISGPASPDRCHHCDALLGDVLNKLFRLQNVSTRRKERINCDEEERLRLGFEIITGVRFKEKDGVPSSRTAAVCNGDRILATLAYGQSSTLWRINKGERRRGNKEQLGFVLDIERGLWKPSDQEQDDASDPMSPRTERVIPFVEDTRNSLLFTPDFSCDPMALSSGDRVKYLGAIVSLQAALKNAIQIEYQMEDSELAVELLPSPLDPRQILLYESAEGGAGVLRRLVEVKDALSRVAVQALTLCHFDSETGEDQFRAPRSTENCAAACYDCLMNYGNQRHHDHLDRYLVRDYLLNMAGATTEAQASEAARALAITQNGEDSLEGRWLQFIDDHGFRKPTGTVADSAPSDLTADFVYISRAEGVGYVVYVDGDEALHPERHARNTDAEERFEDLGLSVIRFGAEASWYDVAKRNAALFGAGAPAKPLG